MEGFAPKGRGGERGDLPRVPRKARLFLGKNEEVLKDLPEGSVDSIVTDPPYGLVIGAYRKKVDPKLKDTPGGRTRKGHMGQGWDAGLPPKECWEECLRLLRPGGYLAAFGGTRTFHRLACDLEDVGFYYCDTLAWLYTQGYPKAKSCLKPAWEPILLVRKSGEKVCNLEIEESLVGSEEKLTRTRFTDGETDIYRRPWGGKGRADEPGGRWPANVVVDEGAAALLDRMGPNLSRVFYCPKADVKQKENGLDGGPTERWSDGRKSNEHNVPSHHGGRDRKNFHPTVKPVDLMRWLITLLTPKAGTTLDPFMGSGTAGIAALSRGFAFVGAEQDERYFRIAEKRIAYVR